jgi:hypothetical protein
MGHPRKVGEQTLPVTDPQPKQYTNREVRLPYQYTNRAAQHDQYTIRELRFPNVYTVREVELPDQYTDYTRGEMQ